MPPKQGNKRKRQVQVRRPTQKKKRRRVARGDNRVSLLQRSVVDPCNGPLVNGIYGSAEGLMARLKLSYSDTSAGTDTAGMILWVPSYHNGNTVAFNMIRFSFVSSSAHCVNTVSTPLGTGGVAHLYGHALRDPGTNLINSTLVNDARTTAACLTMTYTGKVTESSGQIAWIDNYSTTDFLNQLPSVDNMFDRATKTARLGLDTYEVVFRPDEATGTDRFRASGVDDPGFVMGVTGVAKTTQSNSMGALGPKIIGFAYRGCEVGIIDRLVYTAIKAVEWRPETASGLTGVPPQDYVLPSTSNIVAGIDKSAPGWSKRIASGASVASRAVTNAWTGLTNDHKADIARIAANGAYSAWTGNTPPMLKNYAEVW